MIHELNHVGVRVRDMERTLRFYAAFDAQIVFDRMTSDDARIVYLQLGGGLVEFIAAPGSARTAHGIDHLAFLTDDLEADHARLLAAGAVEAAAPKPAGTGVGRLSFVMLGDARLELLERDVDLRRPRVPDGIVADLDHYSMTTPDLARDAGFLTGVLGLVPLTALDVEGVPVRRILGLKGDAVELGTAPPGRGAEVFPGITLRVEDLGAALAELARRGLTGLPAAARPGSGSGGPAVIADPDGVRLELVQRPAPASDAVTAG